MGIYLHLGWWSSLCCVWCRGSEKTNISAGYEEDPGSSSHFLSKNSGFEGPKLGQSLSQDSGFQAIWTAGLSTNSGFEGAAEQKIFKVPHNVTEGEDLAAGMGARFICKRVHELSLGSLGLSKIFNSRETSFLGSITCRPCPRLRI